MKEKVISILSNYTAFEVSNMNENTALVYELGLNSLDIINAVVELEEEFYIKIPENRMGTFQTIGDIFECLYDLE